MAEEIKVTIGADVSQLTAQLTLAENDLRAFQTELKRATNVQDISKLQNSVQILTTRIAGLKAEIAKTNLPLNDFSKTSDKIVDSSKRSGDALMNLGRVVQDAPYGFIGIANNINPLLESFQRLQKDSGGVGGALKSMASSLAGPAGIGIAISVVTSAIVYFSSHTSKAEEAINKLTKANEDHKKALNEIIGTYAAEQVKVDVIIAQIKTETLTRGQRTEAIKQLQQIAPQYFATLDAEKASIEKLDTAYNKFTNSILNSIAVRLKEKELTDITEKILKLKEKGLDVGEQEIVINGKLTKVNKSRMQDQTDINKGLNAYQQFQKGVIGLTIAEQDELDNLILAQKKLIEIVAKNKGAETFDKVTKAAKDSKKEIETIPGILKKLNEDMRDQQAISIAFDKSTLPEQMKLVESAITKLISDFNLSPDSNIIMGLKADVTKVPGQLKNLTDYNELLARVSADAYYEAYQKRLEEKLKNPQKDHKIKIVVPKLELTEFGKQLEDQLKSLNDGIRSTFVSLAEDAIAGFGVALGNAMSGKDAFGNFFASLAKSLGQGMIAIGKMFIKFAAEMLIAKQAIKVNPYLAIIAGIAMVAIGTALNNAIKAQAFAVGTRNAPGGLSLVGERGPELVNIPRGASVIPAAQTSNMMGGMGGAVEVFGVLRGQDIYFSNKKYGLSYGRQT